MYNNSKQTNGGIIIMKRITRIISTALLLVFITTALGSSAFGNTAVVQAATSKISNTKLVLSVGQTKSLKITGTTKKVTWTSSKKSVATVSNKGKVTAVTEGITTITAKVADQKYTCNVTVVNNPYLKEAPFEAEETQIGDINFIIPAGWEVNNQDLGNGYTYTEITPSSQSQLNSIIRIDIRKQEGTPSDYEGFKEAFKGSYTKKLLTPQWKEVFGDTKFEIKDLEQSDFAAPFNSVLRTQYTVKAGGAVVEQTIYDFFIGEYIVSLKAEDYDQMDLAAVTDYMIISFVVK
jgi:hypothetical protein